MANGLRNNLSKALRKGVGPRHQRYFPIFPYTNYSKMTDRDIRAIQAYIMTQPPIREANIPHKLNFPYDWLSVPADKRLALFGWNWLYFPKIDEPTSQTFKLAQGPFVGINGRSEAWNQGAYLVEGPLHCTQCHTPRDEHGGLQLHAWFAGSQTSGDSRPAPNITPDPETGLNRLDTGTLVNFPK